MRRHQVESFRSTLEAALECDLLLHVIDGTSPHAALQRDAVMWTLRHELALPAGLLQRTIEVYTKSDLAPTKSDLAPPPEELAPPAGSASTVSFLPRQPRAADRAGAGRAGAGGAADAEEDVAEEIRISALEGTNMESLRSLIEEQLRRARGRALHTLELPCNGHLGERLSYLHRHPRISVIDTAASADGEQLLVRAEMDSDAHAAWVGQTWE